MHEAQERFHDAIRSSRLELHPQATGSAPGGVDQAASSLASPYVTEHGALPGRGTVGGGPVNITIVRPSGGTQPSAATGGHGPMHRPPANIGDDCDRHRLQQQQQLISLSVPGFDDDGYCELTVSTCTCYQRPIQ
jgi:hypothetical protein